MGKKIVIDNCHDCDDSVCQEQSEEKYFYIFCGIECMALENFPYIPGWCPLEDEDA